MACTKILRCPFVLSIEYDQVRYFWAFCEVTGIKSGNFLRQNQPHGGKGGDMELRREISDKMRKRIALAVMLFLIPISCFAYEGKQLQFDYEGIMRAFEAFDSVMMDADIQKYCETTVQGAPFSDEAKKTISMQSMATMLMEIDLDIKNIKIEVGLVKFIVDTVNASQDKGMAKRALETIDPVGRYLLKRYDEYEKLYKETGIAGFKEIMFAVGAATNEVTGVLSQLEKIE